MKVIISRYDADRGSFNVELASKEGAEPFLSIRGCKVMSGQRGPFISWPARKDEKTGKWFSHVWSSDAFGSAVIAEVDKVKRQPQKANDDDDIPF